MTRVLKVIVLGCSVVLGSNVLWANTIMDIPTAGMNDPVVPGQWHSNLAKATQFAKEHDLPLFVAWGDPGCTYCKAFAEMLLRPEWVEYFAESGMVLVHEHSAGTRKTAIKQWVGFGDYPILRLTWWVNNRLVYDTGLTSNGTSNWQRVNRSKNDHAAALANIKAKVARLEALGFVPKSLDTSKDQYDPENDSEAGAVMLAWRDQLQSLSLMLNETEAMTEGEDYQDLEDWFALPVVGGVNYRAWVSGGAAALEVIGQRVDSEGNFIPLESGTVKLRITRQNPVVAVPGYNLHWQRVAPGSIEFNANSRAIRIREDAKQVQLTVERVNGATGAVTVKVETEEITATRGEDFGAVTPTQLTWVDGESGAKTVTVTLIKARGDVEWEGEETFGVNLKHVNGEASVDAENGAVIVTLLEVDPIRTDPGTYSGWIDEGWPVTLKISARGGITGKATTPSGNFTVRNATVSHIYPDRDDPAQLLARIDGQLVMSRQVPLNFVFELNQATGKAVSLPESEVTMQLYRDDWSTAAGKAFLAPYVGYFTTVLKNLAVTPEGAPQGNGYVTLKINAKGAFRASGKLGDGTPFTQSGVLLREPGSDFANSTILACFYNAPRTHKGGYFNALVEIGDANGNGIPDVISHRATWVNYNPQSLAPYAAEGFAAEVEVIGGFFDNKRTLAQNFSGLDGLWLAGLGDIAPLPFSFTQTVKTLGANGRAVSQRQAVTIEATVAPDSEVFVPFNARGLSFEMPRTTLKKIARTFNEDGSPYYNYTEAVNPYGIKLTYTRTSGLVKGAYSAYYDYPTTHDQSGAVEAWSAWKHKVLKASMVGVMLQESAAGEAAAYGYWLLKGTSPLPNSTRSYRFSQSGGFSLESEDIGLPAM